MRTKLPLLAALCVIATAADAHSWYEGLTSPRGERCCSGPWDCPAVDQRYDAETGRTEVEIDGAWVPVEPDELVNVPSPDGVAHACFWRSWREGRMTPVIRCIILPGDV